MYNNILKKELFSPLTRNWYEANFNEGDLTMCTIKESLYRRQGEKKITETEFVNSADLTNQQLFSFNNDLEPFVEEDRTTLIVGALRHITSVLSTKYMSQAE
mmetsp:Transcript_10037/g.15287  ORF Transcript_10037/g.15287 Transcript_10037/m.15287 type:complete len:102 (+) Transcript_10037:2147-2452(+)